MNELQKVVETVPFGTERFSSVVSNPPYQLLVGDGDKQFSFQIFPFFQEIASTVSPLTSMLYPAHWQKDIRKNLGEFLLNNGLNHSDYYAGDYLFGQHIRELFPISLVATEEGYDGTVLINGVPRPRRKDVWIDSEKSAVVEQVVRGYDSPPLPVSPLELSNVHESGLPFTEDRNAVSDPISVLIKRMPGTQPDTATFYVPRTALLERFPDARVSEYRVACRSAPMGRIRILQETYRDSKQLGVKVFAPDETFGMTWVELNSFSTADEAANYAAYYNTDFVFSLVFLDFSRKTFGSFVPDLGDYSDGNPLFQSDEELGENHEYYGLDLNERLFVFFGLTDAEKEIVRRKDV